MTEAPAGATVLGFAGRRGRSQPIWSVAAGVGILAAVKGWAYRDRESFGRLIETVREAVTAHLIAQLDAGADAVQVFDSWAGALPETSSRAGASSP